MRLSHLWHRSAVSTAAVAFAAIGFTTAAQADSVKTVFVIAMENHNWTQPASDTSPEQIFQNPNAPYINSLVDPSSPNSAQVSFADAYHNALATPSGTGPSIHPSEPNYIWMEAGSNLGVFNDNDPYKVPGGTNQNTTNHLSTLLTEGGKTWKSYQEDIDTDAAGNVLPKSQWISPITSRSGTYTTVPNPYNGSKQFNYAAKHNPQIIFGDTNGGNNATPSNPASQFYAPLQQLQTDLNNNTVANYNWITPNQFNDMHSTLTGGYKGLTGDAASIKQGDDFLSQIVPMIMASQAYKDDGAILLWWDETEGANANDFNHTLPFIVLSPLAKGDTYSNTIDYTHSSTLRTLQEIFGVDAFLGDAANATNLSDLFRPGAIPVPEPSSFGLAGVGLGAFLWARRRRA